MLVEAGLEAGYKTQLVTFEVCSRGMVDFELICSTFKTSTKATANLTLNIRTVIWQSFKNLCSRYLMNLD